MVEARGKVTKLFRNKTMKLLFDKENILDGEPSKIKQISTIQKDHQLEPIPRSIKKYLIGKLLTVSINQKKFIDAIIRFKKIYF
jgi:hypothetical protein